MVGIFTSDAIYTVFSFIVVYPGPFHCAKSVQMRENAEQNNSEYGHFLRSVYHAKNPNFFLRYETLFG